MVHGLLGDDAGHRHWRRRAAEALGGNPAIGRDAAGFAVFVDARVALHLGAFDRAAACTDAIARWRRIGARREQDDPELLLAPADGGRRLPPE